MSLLAQYDRSKNLRPKRNIRTAMNFEVMMYAIAQKEQLGFDKAVEECKYRMSRYGVSPNMLIMPPQMLLYMALAPEAKLTCAAQICLDPIQHPHSLSRTCTGTRRADPPPRLASRRVSQGSRPGPSAGAASC